MEGFCYVFLRKNGAPLPPGCAGHVGWGFQVGANLYFFGATENRSGAPFLPPGMNNDAWGRQGDMGTMLSTFRSLGYHMAKASRVPAADPQRAMAAAQHTVRRGFTALGNNCLDHTFDVLVAYGEQGLPWKQNHPSPNDWFAVFNGEPRNL